MIQTQVIRNTSILSCNFEGIEFFGANLFVYLFCNIFRGCEVGVCSLQTSGPVSQHWECDHQNDQWNPRTQPLCSRQLWCHRSLYQQGVQPGLHIRPCDFYLGTYWCKSRQKSLICKYIFVIKRNEIIIWYEVILSLIRVLKNHVFKCETFLPGNKQDYCTLAYCNLLSLR